MEFWDALEDSQYLDAVASVRDGPRPICKWDIPTTEQLVEWEARVQARTTSTTEYDHDPKSSSSSKDGVEPLSLEWYVSSPIGFFFFSSFVKEQNMKLGKETKQDGANGNHAKSSRNGKDSNSNNGETKDGPPTDVSHQDGEETDKHGSPTTTTNLQKTNALSKKKRMLADQHAFVRMNFVEDLLRFQKNAKTQETRHKQVSYGKRLLQYVRPPLPPTNNHSDGDEEAYYNNYEDDTEPSGAGGGSGMHNASSSGPARTLIRECDLKLPRTSVASRLGCISSSSDTALTALLKQNFDDEYAPNNNTNNPVGLKGPLLKEFISTMSEWIEANENKKQFKKRASDPGLMPFDEVSGQIVHMKEDAHKSVPLGLERPTAAIGGDGSASSKDDKGDDKNNEGTVDASDGLWKQGETDGNEKGNDHNIEDKTSQTYLALHPSESYALDPIVEKVEALVYESLRRDYEAAFRANTVQYKRMRDFLWYQDRSVVYDDFYVMRVLGRGGFGLVSGKLLWSVERASKFVN